ncbi:hypothetical protein C8J57DRAFT_1086020 [Mycena rebaudengoi]|nr:hypothetical protein C8J57DRAFT_1086020 [Mycena rebaudengoi]
MQVPELPTLNRLNATIPADLDVHKVAAGWIESFASFVEAGNVDGIVGLSIEVSHWRDMPLLPGTPAPSNGAPTIHKFLSDRLANSNLTNIRLRKGFPALLRPYTDIAWINVVFDFETDIGLGSGIVRLVPTANDEWKAHRKYTNLDDPKGFPVQIGDSNHAPNHGKWESERQRATAFERGAF